MIVVYLSYALLVARCHNLGRCSLDMLESNDLSGGSDDTHTQRVGDFLAHLYLAALGVLIDILGLRFWKSQFHALLLKRNLDLCLPSHLRLLLFPLSFAGLKHGCDLFLLRHSCF